MQIRVSFRLSINYFNAQSKTSRSASSYLMMISYDFKPINVAILIHPLLIIYDSFDWIIIYYFYLNLILLHFYKSMKIIIREAT